MRAWVAEELKRKDPQAQEDLAMAASLRRVADNDSKLLRKRMLVTQADDNPPAYPPYQSGRGP
eukprot:930023-Prorocentrum_minimum.AAC.1